MAPVITIAAYEIVVQPRAARSPGLEIVTSALVAPVSGERIMKCEIAMRIHLVTATNLT